MIILKMVDHGTSIDYMKQRKYNEKLRLSSHVVLIVSPFVLRHMDKTMQSAIARQSNCRATQNLEYARRSNICELILK